MAKKRPPPGLDDLVGPTTADFQQHHTEEYEASVTGVLCRHYKVPTKVRGQMMDEQENLTGVRALTLGVWHEYFPSFPIYLGAVVIPHLPKDSTVSKLFTSFGRRKFMIEYETLLESRPPSADNMATGLVFRWPHLVGPGSGPAGLVLHNRGMVGEVPGVRILWTPPDDGEPLVIEPLSILLRSIDYQADGRRWVPETSD